MNTIAKILRTLFPALALALVPSCLKLQKSEPFDSNGKYYSDYSISEWLSSDYGKDFSSYLQIFEKSAYNGIFLNSRGYTFIVPNNSAFRLWFLANNYSSVDDLPVRVADSLIAYLTIPERVLSKNITTDSTNMYTSLGGLPIGIHRKDSNYPYQLFINRECPEQDREYVCKEAEVIVQDTEFTDHVADFVKAVPGWEWKNDEDTPPVPPVPTDRLASPVLEVLEYSLASRDSASVSWEDVEGASGYIVALNGVETDVQGNVLNLTGMYGEHQVTVTAISMNPDEKGNSDPASITVNLHEDSDFGSGTEEDPWKLYSAADWNDWASLVTNGTAYAGQFVKLMSDIDFKGRQVLSVGVDGKPFKGVFDGADHVLSNGVIDDGGREAGLFRRATAIIRNLKLSGFTITGYTVNNSMARVGGLCGGAFAGTISNCHLENCTITAIVKDGSNGNQTGGLVAFINDSSGQTVVEDCSLTDCRIVSEKAEIVGGIVGNITTPGNVIRRCAVQGTRINANRIIGGIAGQLAAGAVIDACIVKRCTLSALTRNVSAFAGNLSGMVINGISDGNIFSVGGGASPYGAGAVAAIVNNGAVVVNCISRGNYVTCTDETATNCYLSLGIGTYKQTGRNYVAANIFIQSGTVRYSSQTGNYIGIVSAMLETSQLSNCYYDIALRDNMDISDSPQKRYGCGMIGDEKNIDSEGTIAVETVDISKTEGDSALITKLNDWVTANIGEYPLLKSWVLESGAPTINVE